MLTSFLMNMMKPRGGVLKCLVYESQFLFPIGGALTTDHFWDAYLTAPRNWRKKYEIWATLNHVQWKLMNHLLGLLQSISFLLLVGGTTTKTHFLFALCGLSVDYLTMATLFEISKIYLNMTNPWGGGFKSLVHLKMHRIQKWLTSC